ncbi:hypothetical protein HDU97_000413 [Phlyctochytrium planicorne]|nr:hypothetical protein HDU97_000413 [Phlyctochytrium planicorne]
MQGEDEGLHVPRKFFIDQLFQLNMFTKEDDSIDHWAFGKLKLTRIWVMGTVVSTEDGSIYLDDGTGIIRVDLDLSQKRFRKGDHFLPFSSSHFLKVLELELELKCNLATVIGPLMYDMDRDMWAMHAERVFDKTDSTDAESIWMMEVLDIHRKVYLTDKDIATIGVEGGWM